MSLIIVVLTFPRLIEEGRGGGGLFTWSRKPPLLGEGEAISLSVSLSVSLSLKLGTLDS